MKLKSMADEFLQKVLVARDTAINEEITQDIQSKHEPFKAQMISARDKALANEEQAYKALVEQITKEHNDKVEAVKEDFGKAIQSHKDEVVRSAKAKAEAQYNKFIEGVCNVADEIK